jgi:hypothetical protein
MIDPIGITGKSPGPLQFGDSPLQFAQELAQLRELAKRIRDCCSRRGGEGERRLTELLDELITQTDAAPSVKSSPGAEGPAQSHSGQQEIESYEQFKKRCTDLFLQKEWSDLLQLLNEKTTSLGESNHARNLQKSAEISRDDYKSIQDQERDGVVSADDARRLRVALWSKIIMLIDDIYGQLRF